MITIKDALKSDLETIREIAYSVWPEAYGEILSSEQLTFMLNSFYSDKTLLKNSTVDHHQFIIAQENERALGFASFELDYEVNTTKIHKIYILPETQGKGIGKLLIKEIENRSKKHGSSKLILNVNRFNKAISFYEKMGFIIGKEVDIEIGNGYLMQDYVMHKNLI